MIDPTATAAEFVAWLDARLGPGIRVALADRYKCGADLEVGEAWERLLVWIWRSGTRPCDVRCYRGLPDEETAWTWAFRAASRNYRRVMSERSRSRCGIQSARRAGGDTYSVWLFSELEAELSRRRCREVRLALQDRRLRHSSQLGPSQAGWFSKLMDELTPVQRSTVELMLVGDCSRSEAAELEGVTPEQMNGRLQSTKRQLRIKLARMGMAPAAVA